MANIDRDSAQRPPAAKPRFVAKSGALYWGRELVKRVRGLATSERLILTAFEEQGWPREIDDPLPGGGHDAPKHLRNAIQRLNNGQQRIRFHANGHGDGLWWAIVPKPRAKGKRR